jgi:hypothetical protein
MWPRYLKHRKGFLKRTMTTLQIIFVYVKNLLKSLIKRIVSRDFGTLFLISLDRFEGHYRAGSGLFFILMTFSCLNFKKLVSCGKDPLELMILELLLIGRFLILLV